MDGSLEDLREELCRAQARIAELEQLVNIDELVTLGNRQALREAFDRLRASWADASVREKSASLALLDLVGLNDVNKRRGYAEGDKLLVRFAQYLRRVIHDSAIVGTSTVVTRLGGDEFVVLAAGPGRAETEERLAHLYGSLTPDLLAPGETAANGPQIRRRLWKSIPLSLARRQGGPDVGEIIPVTRATSSRFTRATSPECAINIGEQIDIDLCQGARRTSLQGYAQRKESNNERDERKPIAQDSRQACRLVA